MNILKKEVTAPTTPTSWDPFQDMRALLNWEPFRAMRHAPADVNFTPAFEVKETKEGFVFKADLPGVKENELEITLTGDRLIISGKREAERTEQNETVYAYERTYGAFQRAFTLPTGVDPNGVRAELKEGVLTLLVPRSPEAVSRKIPVKAPEKTKA